MEKPPFIPRGGGLPKFDGWDFMKPFDGAGAWFSLVLPNENCEFVGLEGWLPNDIGFACWGAGAPNDGAGAAPKDGAGAAAPKAGTGAPPNDGAGAEDAGAAAPKAGAGVAPKDGAWADGAGADAPKVGADGAGAGAVAPKAGADGAGAGADAPKVGADGAGAGAPPKAGAPQDGAGVGAAAPNEKAGGAVDPGAGLTGAALVPLPLVLAPPSALAGSAGAGLVTPNWNDGAGVEGRAGAAGASLGVLLAAAVPTGACPKLKAGADAVVVVVAVVAGVVAGVAVVVDDVVVNVVLVAVGAEPLGIAAVVPSVAFGGLLRFRFIPRRSRSSRSSRSRLSRSFAVFQAPTAGRLATYRWSGARPPLSFRRFRLVSPPCCCKRRLVVPLVASPFSRRFLIFSEREDRSISMSCTGCWAKAAAIGDGNLRFAGFRRTIACSPRTAIDLVPTFLAPWLGT